MLLEVKDVCKSYSKIGSVGGKDKLNVLQGINFCVKKGECVGLIGESGSGKSTLSRLILGLEKANSGSILIEGQPVNKWIKGNQGKMSVVFQDYTSSTNPRFTVKEIIAEPMMAFGKSSKIEEKVEELLVRVGLSAALMDRYPHELSGGQVQRVCIARAISTKPKFMVLDEAISSLDVSIQAQILKLLKELKADLDMTYLFIAHDLQAVANLCDQVLFLYKGKIVENVSSNNLINVKNDYAQRLLNSVMPFSL